MMDQTGLGLTAFDSSVQRGQRQSRLQRSPHGPTHTPAGEGVQHNRHKHKLPPQPHIGHVCHPELIDLIQFQVLRQVGIDFQLVLRISGAHELSPAYRQ